ncbi:MAG: hypothetical protein CXZ00_15815 [Acidobacteria bacterium]|nr:MAG: hypothetical protein CXZ00_15815 [Acidobacteriota bacterium]
MYRIISRLLLAFTLVASSAAFCDSNESPEITQDKLPHQRIVDRSQFPPRTGGMSGTLRAPFRWLGEKSEAGMASFEEHRIRERISVILGESSLSGGGAYSPRYKLAFGKTSEQSGFGIKGNLISPSTLNPNVKMQTTAAITTKNYLSTGVAFLADPTGQQFRRVELSITGRYRTFPEEDFFGIGPFSDRRNRSSFALQDRGVAAILAFSPSSHWSAGGGIDASSQSVGNGHNDDLPNTLQIFPGTLPGVGGVQYLTLLAFMQFARGDALTTARSGALAKADLRWNRSLGGGPFSYMQYDIDVRGYIPLATKRRILALRLLANFNAPEQGNVVPFFRLAELGGGEILRGYNVRRFSGQNAIAGSVEYRWDLAEYLGAFVFGDAGQVYDSWEQLQFGNLRGTCGGGIEFKSKKQTFLRIFAGRSGEATRLMVRLGRGF